MKKKVLFVNSSLSGGGSERVMTLLANQFSKIGYDTEMILLREGKDDTYIVDDKIKLVRCTYRFKNKLFKLFSRIIQLRKEIKKNDYIISFMSDINLCTIFSGLGLNKKIVVSERADPLYSGRSKFQFFLERKLYPKAHKVVLQTDYVKRYFTGKVLEKAVVIPNPISDNLPKKNLNKNNKIIVAAGRLIEQKNFKLLINAFYKFSLKNKDYKLLIYGEGCLREELENQVKKLDLENKVQLPGYVKNINDLMKECDIYVSTSNYEGISNSMLEAMAMGIPSICTDCPVGGARLAIVNNTNGILINVGNEEELIEALNKLSIDKELYNNISKNSLKINETFSIDKIVEKWINLF